MPKNICPKNETYKNSEDLYNDAMHRLVSESPKKSCYPGRIQPEKTKEGMDQKWQYCVDSVALSDLRKLKTFTEVSSNYGISYWAQQQLKGNNQHSKEHTWDRAREVQAIKNSSGDD